MVPCAYVSHGRLFDGPRGCAANTTSRELLFLLMGRKGASTRLPAGYTLDLLGDPCVIVLRRADGAVAARFTKRVDPEEVRRAAEEDQRGTTGKEGDS